MTNKRSEASSPHSDFVIPSSLDIRHSSFSRGPIANASRLSELLEKIEAVDRVAVDTEADSLHCYREELCLIQVSLPGRDYVVDPLAQFAGPAFGAQPLPSQQRDRTSDGGRRGWAIQPGPPTGCPPGAARIG